MSISISNRTLGFIHTNLMDTNKALAKSTLKVSEGKRITRAADDAAGLGVVTRMKTDLVSEKQVSRNINDGMSLLQTAEGGISQQIDILIRIRELQIQAMNETYTTTDLEMIQTEMDTLITEGTRISLTNNYNETTLLNRNNLTPVAFDGVIEFQVNIDQGNTISIDLDDFNTNTVFATLSSQVGNGFATGTGVVSILADALKRTFKQTSLTGIDNAFNQLNTMRASLGATQNRLENALAESQTKATNLSAAQSTILDANMAEEITNQTQLQIRRDAGVAAFAQAKSMSQAVLQLLN